MTIVKQPANTRSRSSASGASPCGRTTMMWVGPTSTLNQKGDVEFADCQGVGYR